MANRFWVGGTASWDTTVGTKWAATSGGAGGSSVPTSSDDVFFDANSGTGTVTVTASSVGHNLDTTGFTGTLATGTMTLTNTTTITLGAGGTYSTASISVTPASGTTCTLTMNGKQLFNFTEFGTGTVSLSGAASFASALTLTGGTLLTNNNAVTAGTFASNNSNARTLTLGSSAVTLTGNGGNIWNTSTGSNLTITANTATVTFSGSGATLLVAAGTNLNGMSLSFTGANVATVNPQGGTVTMANLTRTGTALKTDTLNLGGNVSCTGTVTLNGNSSINRLLVQSNGLGTTRTITAATVSASNADFMDITGAGAGNWNLSAITGLSGDCGGNSGITFTTSITAYNIFTGNWSVSTHWSLSSGGTANARTPLPQDDVVFDANTPTGTNITLDMPRAGRSLTFTGYTGTLAPNVATTVFGSLTLAAAAGFSASAGLTLAGRGNYTITSAGKSWGGQTWTVAAPTGTYTLQDTLTITNTLFLTAGTFDTGGFNVTSTVMSSQNTNTRQLNLNSSTWTLTSSTASTTVWNISTPSGMTLNAGTSTINVTSAVAGTMFLNLGGLVHNVIQLTGSQASTTFQFAGGGTLGLTVSSGHTITFATGVTFSFSAWNIMGASGSLTTVKSVTAGTAATLRPTAGATTPFSSDYLSVRDITAQASDGSSGTGLWYAGANSTDVSGNTGWIFTAPPLTQDSLFNELALTGVGN